MEYTQTFFYEGRFLGSTVRQITNPDLLSQRTFLESKLLYCGYCGEVYARFPLTAKSGQVQLWQSFRACCRKCTPGTAYSTPGGLCVHWDKGFIEALPANLLREELLRELIAFEKRGGRSYG